MQRALTLVAILAIAGCGGKKKDGAGSGSSTATGSGSSAGSDAATAAVGSGDGSGSGSGSASAPPMAPKPAPVATYKDHLITPESAQYSADLDAYVVSLINGSAVDRDNNGAILTIAPGGATTVWADASTGAKLDAPKGFAFSGDTLFVADITVVRRFDAKTKKQGADIAIDGASFLNDVVADGKGGIYVSDSAVDSKFQPTSNDAIYHVDKDGKVTTLIKDKTLGSPNGLAVVGDKVWCVALGSGELFSVDATGKKADVQKLPHGMLDGLVPLDGGEFLISSWEGKAIYRGKPGGEWKEVVTGVESPADIGYDTKRKQLLVPVFMHDEVLAFDLK